MTLLAPSLACAGRSRAVPAESERVLRPVAFVAGKAEDLIIRGDGTGTGEIGSADHDEGNSRHGESGAPSPGPGDPVCGVRVTARSIDRIGSARLGIRSRVPVI